MTLTGLLHTTMIIGNRMNTEKKKGARGDDAYLLLAAFKINYYFVPVHRQNKKVRIIIINDNEDYTPEKSCMMCSFHLSAFVIV
jgi:hypothetical protein